MKILAVDDDENIRALLAEAIAAKTPHQVTTVPSGPEAIRAIAKAKIPFDCFLLDVQMPIMDGITLARKIRKTKAHARTPIVMLTAMSQKKYVDAAFSAGATDYVTKPFDFLELFSRINLADRLVADDQRIAYKSNEMASLKRELLYNTSHSLEEPIELMGVTQILGYVGFENHLQKLPRSQLMRSVVFALKINGVETAYKTLPAVAFRHLLTDLASELMSVVANNEAVATYRGSGVFLCALPRNKNSSNAQIEAELNSRLEFVPSAQLDGLVTKVSVGEFQNLRALTRSGSLSAVPKAIESAEMQAIDQKNRVASLRKALRKQNGARFQTETERRAYETLLNEALKNEGHAPPNAAAFG